MFVYGPPKTGLTDNARNFRSKFMMDVHRILGIKNQATTTYHPQTDGQSESFNRTILEGICKYVGDHYRDRDLLSDALTFAYNSHVSTSTGFAPFELVLSRPPEPLSFAKDEISPKRSATEAKVAWLKKLQEVTEATRGRLVKANQRTKENFDRRLRNRRKNINRGDCVYLHLEKENAAEGHRHKLAPKAKGPFELWGEMKRWWSFSAIRSAKRSRLIDWSSIMGHEIKADGSIEFEVKWALSRSTTFEPVAHLPYTQIARYCARVFIPLPPNIDEARAG